MLLPLMTWLLLSVKGLKRAISEAMLWRRNDTDVQDDFPINYNEEDTDRIAELSTSGVISCDQGSRRQGDYHGRFLEASRLEHDFGDVKKLDQKIAKAHEKKEKLALAKVNTKPAGEAIAPIHQSIPKPLYETAELKGKEVETSIVNLSDLTREATPSLMVRTPKEKFIQVDNQTKNANVSDAHSYHSVHKEENDEDADDHCYIPTWGLRSDLRISSYRACKEMISHLATPPKKEVLSSLTNYECSERERELSDRLKDIEREKDEWRQRASTQVEEIKQLKEDLRSKSKQLADLEDRVVEYRKSLAIPIRLYYTMGWLGGLGLGQKKEEIADILTNTSNLDIDDSKAWKDKHSEFFTLQHPYVQKIFDSHRLSSDELMKVFTDVPSPTIGDQAEPSV
ncbi:hypothetical protein Tco_0661490 [Tanacetum coccineum]